MNIHIRLRHASCPVQLYPQPIHYINHSKSKADDQNVSVNFSFFDHSYSMKITTLVFVIEERYEKKQLASISLLLDQTSVYVWRSFITKMSFSSILKKQEESLCQST